MFIYLRIIKKKKIKILKLIKPKPPKKLKILKQKNQTQMLAVSHKNIIQLIKHLKNQTQAIKNQKIIRNAN